MILGKDCKIQIGTEIDGETVFTDIGSTFGAFTFSADNIPKQPEINQPLNLGFTFDIPKHYKNDLLNFFNIGKSRSRRTKHWYAIYQQYKKLGWSARVAKSKAWKDLKGMFEYQLLFNNMDFGEDVDQFNISFEAEMV